MFQREQQQAAVELQRFNNTIPGCGEDITPPPSSLGSTPSPCWNNAMHHPIRFNVLPFHQHHSLIQQTHSLCPLPLVIKTETKPLDSDDSDVEVDVTSTPSSPPSPILPSSSVPLSQSQLVIKIKFHSQWSPSSAGLKWNTPIHSRAAITVECIRASLV